MRFKHIRLQWVAAFLCGAVFVTGCSKQAVETVKSTETIELKTYPMDDMTGVLTQSGVAIDKQITVDGQGSLRVSADKPVTIRLFETGDLDIESAQLLYQARVRTENVEGQAYLEMWCHFDGKGEYFSRALQSPVMGTTDWVTQETPFFLKKGENPDNVKLNLVIAGTGTAWIDDIRLVKSPLPMNSSLGH